MFKIIQRFLGVFLVVSCFSGLVLASDADVLITAEEIFSLRQHQPHSLSEKPIPIQVDVFVSGVKTKGENPKIVSYEVSQDTRITRRDILEKCRGAFSDILSQDSSETFFVLTLEAHIAEQEIQKTFTTSDVQLRNYGLLQ